MKFNHFLTIAISIGSLTTSCSPKEEAKADWIIGSPQDQVQTIERQFRGFDMAMVETGYRYQELYWAGKDQNWDYATYQLTKIKTAIENGIERRPRRATSAKHFLDIVIPKMQETIDSKDSIIFQRGFKILKAECHSCHIKENVSFIQVNIPQARASTIKFD
jgi:hypothetical protein